MSNPCVNALLLLLILDLGQNDLRARDEDKDGLSTLNMYRLMKATYSVARTAVDSSLEAALKLGLVDQYTSQRFKVNILTLKGIAAAVKLKELETILSSDSVI